MQVEDAAKIASRADSGVQEVVSPRGYPPSLDKVIACPSRCAYSWRFSASGSRRHLRVCTRGGGLVPHYQKTGVPRRTTAWAYIYLSRLSPRRRAPSTFLDKNARRATYTRKVARSTIRRLTPLWGGTTEAVETGGSEKDGGAGSRASSGCVGVGGRREEGRDPVPFSQKEPSQSRWMCYDGRGIHESKSMPAASQEGTPRRWR
jgi:hypothetical protein